VKVSIQSLAAGGAAFGTSGVRGTVEALTDRVCFAYSAAFLQALGGRLEGQEGGRTVAVGYDLRPSSPRMTTACIAACQAEGARALLCGALATPALAHYALSRGVPAIMVTGSHIPFDRNGIKFYTGAGEISKEDEIAISEAVISVDETAFEEGRLRNPPSIPAVDGSARELYRDRYLRTFRPGLLAGRRIGVYQHSSVARDLLSEVLQALGAKVVELGRTDTFVPVDTEAVSADTEELARSWTLEHALDALVSTDGDADRPLVGDETGTLLRGDIVGLLSAQFLRARTVVTPVSSNTALERTRAFDCVLRTRIGSPYVIAAMSDAARRGGAPVVGYEANGGFLLFSDVELHTPSAEGRLSALPTRDALLPILALLAQAADQGVTLSRMRESLPPRHTASDRLADFPTARSRQLLHLLAGSAVELSGFFAELGKIAEVNRLDGLRVTLESGDIVHLRPSGNAPELRCYAEASTRERAVELSRWGLRAANERSRLP